MRNIQKAAVSFFVLPISFCSINFVMGSRPLLTKFEAGAIVGIVVSYLIDFIREYFTPDP
jgi:hypothetical protein